MKYFIISEEIKFKVNFVLLYHHLHCTVPTISDVFSNADVSLFKAVLKNSYHVLNPYLPENQYQHYHLRQRLHNKALIPKTTYLSDRYYIIRMLYKNCY